MAQQELEAALRRAGDNEAHAIWQSVEAEAERLRGAATQALDRQRQSAAARGRVESAALQDAAMSAARKQAQHSRLDAEERLARRLKKLAQGQLEKVARSGGPQLFQALAAEIPASTWQCIRVNPRDATAAQDAFPNAEIMTDTAISAGLEVQSADQRIRIVNSLEKRLAHLWPELLPKLFKELRPLAGDDESFA